MAKYPLLDAYDGISATFSYHANLCEECRDEEFPSEAYARMIEVMRLAAPQYRELARLTATIAALMQQVIDEAEEAGVKPPFLTHEELYPEGEPDD